VQLRHHVQRRPRIALQRASPDLLDQPGDPALGPPARQLPVLAAAAAAIAAAAGAIIASSPEWGPVVVVALA
jgi:hypothetical protein